MLQRSLASARSGVVKTFRWASATRIPGKRLWIREMLETTYELLKRLNDSETSPGCVEELSHLSKLLRWLKKQSKRKNPSPQQVKVSSNEREFVVRPFDDATFFIRQLLLRIRPPLDSDAMQDYVIASTSFLRSNVVAECSKLGLIQNESTEIRQPIDAAIAVSDIALEGIDSRIATVARQLHLHGD